MGAFWTSTATRAERCRDLLNSISQSPAEECGRVTAVTQRRLFLPHYDADMERFFESVATTEDVAVPTEASDGSDALF